MIFNVIIETCFSPRKPIRLVYKKGISGTVYVYSLSENPVCNLMNNSMASGIR